MTVSYSTTLRNNRLDEVTTAAGATAFLQVWDGAVPATPATAPATRKIPQNNASTKRPTATERPIMREDPNAPLRRP